MNKKIILIFFIFLTFFTGCGTSNKLLTDEGVDRYELTFLHNKERMIKNFTQLIINDELQEKAQNWAEYMAKTDKLKHSKIGSPNFGFMGENIAWGQKNVDEVIKAWMNSSGHRRNILDQNYTNIGLGYARMENGMPYWCVQFGGK
jgi:uncharacterized protein YkwD